MFPGLGYLYPGMIVLFYGLKLIHLKVFCTFGVFGLRNNFYNNFTHLSDVYIQKFSMNKELSIPTPTVLTTLIR